MTKGQNKKICETLAHQIWSSKGTVKTATSDKETYFYFVLPNIHSVKNPSKYCVKLHLHLKRTANRSGITAATIAQKNKKKIKIN